MELECDLGKINNEELLRKMWQQSQDPNRKKEIRSQLYKLRESRLRDLYQGDIMADNSLTGFGKDPLVTSHGDALAGQSFESLKSKEIRDSLSPTEMKFQSMALNNPNTTGWNVQSSKEVSPDGRGFRTETLATTDGIENINGGTAEFKGRNEHLSSAHHQGDDKNFVKKAMESSNSHLQEKVVIGDENSGRTEIRTSSSTSTSSSQVVQSSTNVEYDDGIPIQQQPYPAKYIVDSKRPHQQELQQRQQLEQERLLEEQRIYEQQFEEQRKQHVNQQERRTTEQVSTTRQNTQQKNISQNIQTQEMHDQNKRYIDMDKASPEYQQHVQQLMQQPGEIISNTVEYPKPNVKMITTVKRLPDGTIVRNKRYETEELPPPTATARPSSTANNQTQPRRDPSQHQQQPTRNYQPDSHPHARPNEDMVDSGSPSPYAPNTYCEDVETKYSAVKKSSHKVSTQSTSETIEEYNDHHSHGEPLARPKSKNNDFSTHGFPSVRPNKPTQEYPTDRPQTAEYPKQGLPTQTGTPRPNEAAVPHDDDNTDNITERRVNTRDGEVIIVSSEKKRNFKTSSNSERIVETERVVRDDQPYQQIPDKRAHGFPSVREPNNQQPKYNPNEKHMQPHEQDFPLDKLPPGTRIVKSSHSPHGEEEVVVVSSQKSQTAKHSTNTERIIEHEVITDDRQGYPRIQHKDDAPYHYIVTTPGDQTPRGEFPGSPKKPTNADYSTQGFPSVRTPDHAGPGEREPYGDYPAGTPKHSNNDYSTQGFPSVRTPTRPAAGLPSNHNQHPSSPRKSPSQDYPTQGFPSVRSPSKGTSPTQGYPSNVDGGRPKGTGDQPRATPTSKTPSRTPSPNKYKAPSTTVRETTERIIRKEKEVDSAHRAFAASLRSSSPIDHVKREIYTTDSHTRQTPRSSVSSSRTFRRDMREGSHDSAPSETSRISTGTVTRNTPPRTVGGRTVVTRMVTTKTGHGSNDTLHATSPRGTKSPSPGKTVTTTTTTTRTLTSKDVPKATDNQHNRIARTTNKTDKILPINDPSLTSITKNKFSDNHKQLHNKQKDNIGKKNTPVRTDATASASASASTQLEEVIEPPCIKKHYYKLGPSDHTQAQLNTTTFQSLKSSKPNEKSPTKKQSSQPQPAPSSRSSTPSHNSRKLPTKTEVADDNDDDTPASSFSPPSTRSRTPQKIAPNDNDIDKPQDDWQKPRRPDSDERRTVNREITFEKPAQPRKPNFEQPNVEWVVVDDYDDDDNDDDDDDDDHKDNFAPEVVDAKLHVRKTTTKLITQEKQSPAASPQRKTKPITTTTTPSKSQIKPDNKSPLKTKHYPEPRTTQKSLTESKNVIQTSTKLQTKVVDKKPLTKTPKSTAPSYTAPLGKPLPKTSTEGTTLRKTFKTSAEVLKEKSIKLIEAEKTKRKPQSPERKTKPQYSPTGVVEEETTEITHRRQPESKSTGKPKTIDGQPIQPKPYDNEDEPMRGRPQDTEPDTDDYEKTPDYKKPDATPDQPTGFRKPLYTDKEPKQYTSDIQTPQDTDNKPKHKSPVFRKPVSPGFQKLQSTFDERSPQYGKPYLTDDEPNENSPNNRIPQGNENEPHFGTPFHKKPEYTDDKPSTHKPNKTGSQTIVEEQRYPTREPSKHPESEPTYGRYVPQQPQHNEYELISEKTVYRKPEGEYEPPHQGTLDDRSPQQLIEKEIITTKKTQKIIPEGERSPESPQIDETNQDTHREPSYGRPIDNDLKPGTRNRDFEPFEESEVTVVNSHKAVAKHIQKFETNYLRNQPTKPQQDTKSQTRQLPQIEKKVPKTPVKETIGTKSPERVISPSRNQKKPEEPTAGRRPQSPSKPVSPYRLQNTQTEHTDKRPKSPSKSVSPLGTNKQPIGKVSPNDETFTTSFETTRVVKENITKLPTRPDSPTKNQKKPDGKLPENIPEKRAQSPYKHISPTRTQKKPDQTVIVDDQKVPKTLRTTDTVKENVTRIVGTKDYPSEERPKDKLPGDKCKEPTGKRPQSPNKYISPTRSQKEPHKETFEDGKTFTNSLITTSVVKKTSKHESDNKSPTRQPVDKKPQTDTSMSPARSQIQPVRDDETFKTSLRTSKIVTEKTTNELYDKEYPKKTVPYKLDDKRGTKPEDRKPYYDNPSDNEEAETRNAVTNEHFISSKTCHITEKLIDEPQYPAKDFPFSNKTHQKPGVKYSTGNRPESPTKTQQKPTTQDDTFKEPGTKYSTGNRPESPTITQKKPTTQDDSFKTTMTIQRTVTEKTTENVDRDVRKLQELESPSSPTQTSVQKLPQQTGKRPQSPIRGQNKPSEIKPEFDDLIKTVTSIEEEDGTVKKVKPKFHKPTETDKNETVTTTTEFVIKPTNTPKYPGWQEPIKDTSEFMRTTSQKLIETEQQTFETEQELHYVDNKRFPTGTSSPKEVSLKSGHYTEDREESPTRMLSPKTPTTGPKSTSVVDETFKKSLRTTKFDNEKAKPKDRKPNSDEEDTEDLLIEVCEKSYVTERNIATSEKEQTKPRTPKPQEKEPDETKLETPLNKPFTTTYVETIETIEGQTYPEDSEQFPKNKHPITPSQDPWLPKQVPKFRINVNEQFIETERARKETPDGAFISKTIEPSTPISPTFRKKGAGRSDTFEERCRQILGMETYGDTPGAYKRKEPTTEVEEKKATPVIKEIKSTPEKDTSVFQVKIEDCDEDDEQPFSINSVKKTLLTQRYTTEKAYSQPVKEEPAKRNIGKEPVGNIPERPTKPQSRGTVEPKEDNTKYKPKYPKDDKNEFTQTIKETTTTVHKKSSKSTFDDETGPDSSEPETVEEREIKTTELKTIKKFSPKSSPRSGSPTKSTPSPRPLSPIKRTSSPKKDSPESKLKHISPQKPDNNTTTIKDRLRSSTRKQKSTSKLDQVDGSESSPEHSPTRYTGERRRSSNISVTTEIIIEHTDSDTPNKKENSPSVTRKPQDSVFKEIIDSTVMPEKLIRRMPVTERKESAPVHRVTNRDKDSKMSRSTSENLIKVKKPEPHTHSSPSPNKITDHRRPNKCFATKSINLSATDRFVNTENMENVIIDIQHAKSSREPSPDKIVPTPVPAHLDTGKPRYPDVVQEPEDDHSKRNPQVKNIPIFEEENNSYIGCHITEVNVERTHKNIAYDSLDYEEQILKNPVVEAPPSLDYTAQPDTRSDDESLLTVHEKVSKFQNITRQVQKPKGAELLQHDDDECLVVINKTTDKLVEDEEFSRNEHVYTTVKLGPTVPQKSPELVRTITRNISRQHEPDFINETNDDREECVLTSRNDEFVKGFVNNKKITKEFEVSHQPATEKYQQPEDYHDDDDDELIPHTATHTTVIEERRQKDILSRPSVFDSRNKSPTVSTATTITKTKTPPKCNQSPVKDSEKLRPDIKSHTNTPLTQKTTATTTATATETETAISNKPKQSPQRKNSDIDYELRGGSKVETGVKNIISKQTKLYSQNISSDSKTNDLKKSTTSNKKPEKHMPVRLTPAKNSDEYDLSADDEMIINVDERTDIDIQTQVVNEELKKETNRKIPLTTSTITTTTTAAVTPQKKQPTVHSSTNSSPTDQPLKTKTKTHVVKLTDKNPLKPNTVTTTTTTSYKTYETVERADDIDETVLEPTTKKSPSHPSHTKSKPNKMSISATDSVAARRSLFESNNGSPSATPTKRGTPLTSPMSGRRPSYMDHTKSSLEHTRRDSLEINKTTYSRKPSHPDDEVAGHDRNSIVKFDVPHGKRTTSVTEDINVEDIFELEVLEKLLETVQSYEIRRRIRAQIRLIKKNQRNELISSSTDVITRSGCTYKEGSEEADTVTSVSSRKPKPEDKPSNVSSTKKEYIFEETYHPTTRRSPKPNRYPNEEEKKQPVERPARSQSPQTSPVCRRNLEHERRVYSPDHQQQHTGVVREHGSTRITKQQQYYYKDEQGREEEVHEIQRHDASPTRKSPSRNTRKPHSSSTSPERRYSSPESYNERSRSPQMKKSPQSGRVTSSRSPDAKTSAATTVRKSSTSYEQQQEAVKTKPQTKTITTITTTMVGKSKPEDKTPVWADRKNILKTPSSTTPTKKPSTSSSLDSRASGYTKTVKSVTSQKMTTNNSSVVDDDCVTSSYGIGPTDENGLPLFGIRALKKKKPTVEPSETTEEVTGYVVEEKYYSDNKSKPTVERKQFIYSTNPEELQKLKEQSETTMNRKGLKDVDLTESRQTALISKATPALRSSPEDDFLDSTTKYVRRGSVKEMSEKFIQKEAGSTVIEKSNNYPKAGLILRTNSRKNSRDVDNENDNFESYKTTRVQQHHSSTVLADSDDAEQEYEVEEVASRHSGRFITESESECDSIKTQREFKKITSSSSSSTATRSFLNSQGEEKVVTNVSDCLARMRNADDVVEEGDTAEDQEARALLNKFFGATIIMKGVESSIPATNRQSKTITTTTTTGSNLSDDNEGDNNAKHEVKTTRITKTIKSGSSSTPVTHTTCDIEEIWDEELLKELLEQARTYEERRKIRSRLRELMADREEPKKGQKGEEKAEETTTPVEAANSSNEEEESASEYEEIIEEVTDYSEAESEVNDNIQNVKLVTSVNSQEDKEKSNEGVVTKTEQKSIIVTAKLEKSSAKHKAQTEQVEETKTLSKTEIVDEVVEETSVSDDQTGDDQTDSSEKGESLKPMMRNTPQNTQKVMPQQTVTHSNQPPTNSQKLKSAQISSNNNSKTTTVNESSSMYASHNNSNNKSQKAIPTVPTSSQNPVVTVQTAGRTDSTSMNTKNIRNSYNNSSIGPRQTNSHTNSDSGRGSLGGNSVVVGSNDGPRQVDRLGVPQKEDSGTESGEDLRLIAAGLRDQLQIQSDSNIIEDVTCALSRLENSLKEGKDIAVDTEKRKALLALVARLRAGLTSPEKLAEIAAAMSQLDGNEGLYGETSSPEADAHRSNRSRFGKRKNRVNRHTVGVSREELADARRYMEDMLLMSNISQSTTPEANSIANTTPPQWYPLEKNASTGTILTQSLAPVLQRPKQFIPEESAKTTYTNRSTANTGKRRPHSGEFSVSFENPVVSEERKESLQTIKQGSSTDDSSKSSRFTNKKHLMKRANTIDLAKTHKYNPELDTDSDADDKTHNSGLKRAVQVSVKKRVQNVVPPFEPKTENDRKFLAFINKQSDKPGLGWTASRSVSNWSNKFGSIKSTFEGGLAAKPPQAPHHVSANTRPQQPGKLFAHPATNYAEPFPAPNHVTNQQIAQRLQREADRQAEERRKKLEREHLEYERRERDKLERQRQQRERQERDRLEREYLERQRREQDQISAAQHAAIFREQEQLTATQKCAVNTNIPQPIPINEFKHAPQSVFRPIDNTDGPSKAIYKPIPQLPRNAGNWQPLSTVAKTSQPSTSTTASSPAQCGNTRPDNSFITSPPPSVRSPIALPWASKPTVNNSSFKSKANKFEERSKYDNINSKPVIQRHNSLRSTDGNSKHTPDEYRKRPSLPDSFDSYSIRQHDPLAYLPPPQNISFTYSSLKPKTTYQSYPCLPTAVIDNSRENDYRRLRLDSLTDPHAVPLVLTSSYPSYCPPAQALAQSQPQPQPHQLPRMPRQYDLVSPADSEPTSPSIYHMQQNDFTDDDLDSDNNLLEYRAVSRVMRKPQSQTAVTVGRRSGHISDDELYGKNSRAAKSLLTTMKSLGNSNGISRSRAPIVNNREAAPSPKPCLSPDGLSYQAPIVEPLFPEINKFESNRKQIYNDEAKKKTTTSTNPTYPQPAPHNQFGMYKSLENLSRTTPKSQTNFTQQPPSKPYVSETQTSYVVTYPVEDTTDDEDFSRLSHKKVKPPNSLDLRRQRKVSENSTGSSTTASLSFGQNLPSPNTSWTSNPIAQDESRNYQNMPSPGQNSNNNLTSSPAEPTYKAPSSQATKTYANGNDSFNLSTSAYKKKADAQQQQDNGSAKQLPKHQTQANTIPIPTSKPVYEVTNQGRQFQQQQSMYQNTTIQKSTSQQSAERNQKPAVKQTLTDYSKQSSTKTMTSTSAAQKKNSLTRMYKSEDHQSLREAEQTILNPKHSNISQEMLIRLDQQRERISNETRRKSLENVIDCQVEKQARSEIQNSQVYKSSAPPDTPDIVKSSLPKDETQPILKKFGPPQRHHYMPNSYQNPSANTTSSTSIVATTKHSTKMQGKHIHSTSQQTVVENSTAKHIVSSNVPCVVETPATPQPDDDYIPRNIVYNNIHAFSSMARRQENENSSVEEHHVIRPSKLSKSDSWNQILMLQNQHTNMSNTSKLNQSPNHDLRRTKSGHTLALPKMFEAAMTKTDISEKQKTVAAYFSGQKSPTQQETLAEQLQQTAKRSVINRIKTTEKVSAASRKSLGSMMPVVTGGLQRSATMPHIANLNFLDESNVEDAFEQLIMEQKQQNSSSTTEKTETKEKDGAIVTTTTKVTTRTVAGSAAKSASPFAKFKQLDTQNTQQSAKSPTTPTTTAGGSTASSTSGNQAIFKFTDPALNAKAATVKEQLLQWCQSKTQEYENIEITNFSTSWNNGLAFCALIHHFLPDAFDYSQLTPKNRRKNFELAFTVADEKAGIAPLLDVEDMVVMQRPDWKCVFVYVQSIYRRFRNCQ